MIEHLLPIDEIVGFNFERKPIPLPPDLRPMWKISQIMLVIKLCSRSEKTSILKLQVFNWALISIDNMRLMKDYILNENKENFIFIHLDPSVNRAVEFGIGEHLLSIDDKGHIHLTEKGRSLTNKIIEDEDLLVKEKELLNFIGKRISETKVKKFLRA